MRKLSEAFKKLPAICRKLSPVKEIVYNFSDVNQTFDSRCYCKCRYRKNNPSHHKDTANRKMGLVTHNGNTNSRT